MKNLLRHHKRGTESAVPHYLISISPYALYGIHSGCSPTRKAHTAATSAVLLVVLVHLNTYFGRKLCSQALHLDRGVHAYVHVCSREAMEPE